MVFYRNRTTRLYQLGDLDKHCKKALTRPIIQSTYYVSKLRALSEGSESLNSIVKQEHKPISGVGDHTQNSTQHTSSAA